MKLHSLLVHFPQIVEDIRRKKWDPQENENWVSSLVGLVLLSRGQFQTYGATKEYATHFKGLP